MILDKKFKEDVEMILEKRRFRLIYQEIINFNVVDNASERQQIISIRSSSYSQISFSRFLMTFKLMFSSSCSTPSFPIIPSLLFFTRLFARLFAAVHAYNIR